MCCIGVNPEACHGADSEKEVSFTEALKQAREIQRRTYPKKCTCSQCKRWKTKFGTVYCSDYYAGTCKSHRDDEGAYCDIELVKVPFNMIMKLQRTFQQLMLNYDSMFWEKDNGRIHVDGKMFKEFWLTLNQLVSKSEEANKL